LKKPATATDNSPAVAQAMAGRTRDHRPLAGLLAALRRSTASRNQLPPGLILIEDPWVLQESLDRWCASPKQDQG